MKTAIELTKKWMYYTFPKLTVLVTVEDKTQPSKPNIITVTWHSPVSLVPPQYGISIDPSRYSHDLIAETGEFVVNFAGFEVVDDMHFCGRRSGRKFDKFKDTNLTPENAQVVNAPLIKECYVNLECKLVDKNSYGDHTWFVGEVVAVSADEDWFEDGVLKKGKQPIYYLGNNIYNSFGTDWPRVKK